MWVILNHVKADKREQFEHFVHRLLKPAAEQCAPAIAARVRLLEPAEPNPDGTYTYVMLMDPVVAGRDYGSAPLLAQAYDEAQASAYGRLFREALATPQARYELVQSPW